MRGTHIRQLLAARPWWWDWADAPGPALDRTHRWQQRWWAALWSQCCTPSHFACRQYTRQWYYPSTPDRVRKKPSRIFQIVRRRCAPSLKVGCPGDEITRYFWRCLSQTFKILHWVVNFQSLLLKHQSPPKMPMCATSSQQSYECLGRRWCAKVLSVSLRNTTDISGDAKSITVLLNNSQDITKRKAGIEKRHNVVELQQIIIFCKCYTEWPWRHRWWPCTAAQTHSHQHCQVEALLCPCRHQRVPHTTGTIVQSPQQWPYFSRTYDWSQ